jgi:hypothetical protein
MRIIRAVAIGLGLSAFFVVALYERFSAFAGGWKIWSIITDLSYRTSNISEAAESRAIFMTVYILVCLSLGLFAGSFYVSIAELLAGERKFPRAAYAASANTEKSRTNSHAYRRATSRIGSKE